MGTPLSLMTKMRKKLGPGTRMRTSQTTSKTGMLLTQRKPLGSRLTQRSPRPRSPHGLKPTQRKLPGSRNSGRRSIQTEMETGTGMTKKMSLQKKSSKLPGRSGLLPTQIKPHGPRLIQRRLLPRSRHGLKLIKIRSRLGLKLIQSKPLGSRKNGKHTTPLSLMMKMRKKLGPGTRMRTSQTTSKTGMLLTQRKPLGSRLTQRSPRPRSPHGLKPTQRKLPGSRNSGRRSIQTEMETGTGMTKKMSLQKKSSKLPGRSGLLPTQIKPHGPRLIQRRLLPRSRHGLKL